MCTKGRTGNQLSLPHIAINKQEKVLNNKPLSTRTGSSRIHERSPANTMSLQWKAFVEKTSFKSL